MRFFRCVIARTKREVIDAQRLRWKVFSEEEELIPSSVSADGRQLDSRDHRSSTIHFLVYAGEEPVGTVRLLLPNAATKRAGSGRLGFDLESKFDLCMFMARSIVPAEVTRFCVLRKFRRTRATGTLFSALGTESARRGITHWVAGASMETDVVEDAMLAYRIAREKQLVNEHFRAEPLVQACARTQRRWSIYTDDQRRRAAEGDLAGLILPRTLSLFAKSMGARYMGPPVFDTYFNVFALPLVVALTDARTDLRAEDPLVVARDGSGRGVVDHQRTRPT